MSTARGLGGPNRSLETLLEHLPSSIWTVVASPTGRFLEEVEQKELSAGVVPLANTHTARGRVLATLKLAAWSVRHRGSFTVVLANGISALNVVGVAAALTRSPVVVWAHASRMSRLQTLLGRLWTRLLGDVHIAPVSDAAREVLVDSDIGTTAQWTIIPNPIDRARVVASDRVPGERVRIAFLSGPTTVKGADLLPDTMELLRPLAVTWHLYSGAWTRPSSQSPLTERVRHIRDVDMTLHQRVRDVQSIYGNCDIVFCPSRAESFGRAAAEAMANGLPVVGSDIQAFRSLVGDRSAGLLFPVGDADAAAEAIRELVLDPDLRAELGKEGRRRSSEFTPDAVVAAFVQLFDRGADALDYGSEAPDD